jgi:hypothetical protein
MKRQVPKMTTDDEAEAFLEADLSDLDFSQFKPARFQFADKLTRQGKTVRKPTSAASRPVISYLAPGTPAPRSGIYEQRGPRGGHTGQQADAIRGKPLPPTPSPGRTWTLVEPAHHKGDTHDHRDGYSKGSERGRKRGK